MAFCNKCGAELKDGAKFCPKCGESIDANTNIVESGNSKIEEYSNLILKIYDESLGRYRYSKAKLIGVLGFLYFFLFGLFSLDIFTIIIETIVGLIVYGICLLIGNFVRKFL